MNMGPHVIPFRIGGPIQDPVDFIGRREILQDISSDMLNLQNVSLRGERRTGKTSLLLYLAHPDSSAAIGLPGNHIPVYFNFQGLPQANAAKIWQEIGDTIAKQIQQKYSNRPTESEQFLPVIKDFLTFLKKGSDFTGFVRALVLLDHFHLKINLLFDEFEQTARNLNLGDSFYDALRSLPTRTENISYVIATRTGLAALQPTYNKVSSPFFNIFKNIILGPFQENEVYDLIFDYFSRAEVDLSLAEKLCTQSSILYEVTGYHPFFLQTLCYYFYKELDKPNWPLDQAQQEALHAFEKDAEQNFGYYWRVSSKKEQELIKELVTKQPIDWGELEKRGPIKNLKDRCLVVQANTSENKWQLFSSSFAKWIRDSMQHSYHLKNIRTLLIKEFTLKELHHLYHDADEFRPVWDELSENLSKAEMIDKLIEYAQQKLQLENLLALAQEYNPVRYEEHQPYHDPDTSTIQILLVDDNEHWRKELSALLHEVYGYRVVTTASKEEVMQRIKHDKQYDLAIIDMRLDEEDEENRDGVELGFWFRDEGYNLPIIILTAYNMEAEIARNVTLRPFQFAVVEKGKIGSGGVDDLLRQIELAVH